MNILVVYAHDEPSSFTAALKNEAAETLARMNHAVVVSDLYGQGFNPVAQKWDFTTTRGEHFNYMLEQKHSAKLDLAFAPDILAEMQKVQAADLVLFIAPLYWSGVPALLKGWFERVLAMGFAWDEGKIYQNGLLKGKQAMLVMPASQPASFYQPDGVYKAGIKEILHPINYATLAYCGFNVHEPFLAFDVLKIDGQWRTKQLADFKYRLQHLFDSPQWMVRFS